MACLESLESTRLSKYDSSKTCLHSGQVFLARRIGYLKRRQACHLLGNQDARARRSKEQVAGIVCAARLAPHLINPFQAVAPVVAAHGRHRERHTARPQVGATGWRHAAGRVGAARCRCGRHAAGGLGTLLVETVTPRTAIRAWRACRDATTGRIGMGLLRDGRGRAPKRRFLGGLYISLAGADCGPDRAGLGQELSSSC